MASTTSLLTRNLCLTRPILTHSAPGTRSLQHHHVADKASSRLLLNSLMQRRTFQSTSVSSLQRLHSERQPEPSFQSVVGITSSHNPSRLSLCNSWRRDVVVRSNFASPCSDATKTSCRSYHTFFRKLAQASRPDTEASPSDSDTQTPPPSAPPSPSPPSKSGNEKGQKPLLERISTTPLPIPLPASTKHENIYTLPNILTFTRLVAAPCVGYFILNSQPIAALSLFFYAGVTDLVDGYLARRYNLQTVVGTVIDPMADKLLMTISVVALSISGAFPWWIAAVILGRDVGLAISAIYFRYISLPEPKTFARYWDFSLPSAEVHPTEISKINTLLQLLLVGNAMVLPVLPVALVDAWNLHGIFEGWQFLVAGTTVWSGASYIWAKDAVKILNKDQKKAKIG